MGVWLGAPEIRATYEAAKQDFRQAKRILQRELERKNGILKDYRIGSISGKECVFIHQEVTGFEVLHMEQFVVIFLHKDKTLFIVITDTQANFAKNRPVFDSIIGSFRFD